MIIFLDMDSVLCDWYGGISKLFNCGPITKKHADEHLGFSKEKLWDLIGDAGVSFWENLEPYPWTFDLYQLCSKYGQTCLLTSPSSWPRVRPHACAGKVNWINKHFGPDFSDFLIGKPKHYCANPNTVLIDDHESNIKKFNEAGGRTILFPHFTNKNGKIKDKLKYIKSRLTYIRNHKDKVGSYMTEELEYSPPKMVWTETIYNDRKTAQEFSEHANSDS